MKLISILLFIVLLNNKISSQERYFFKTTNSCFHFIGYVNTKPTFFDERNNDFYQLEITDSSSYNFKFLRKGLKSNNEYEMYPSWINNELEIYISPPYMLVHNSGKLDTVQKVNIYGPFEYNLEAFSLDTTENRIYFTMTTGIQDSLLNWIFDKILYIDLNSEVLNAKELNVRAYNLKIIGNYIYFLNETNEGKDQICRVKIGNWEDIEILLSQVYSWGWTIFERSDKSFIFSRIKLQGRQQNVLYDIQSREIIPLEFKENRQIAPFFFDGHLFYNFIKLDDHSNCKPYLEKIILNR